MAYSPELIDAIIKAQDMFVWEAPEREHRYRGSRWYLLMSIVCVVFVVYAVATGNFLLAFMILLGAIILVLAGNEEPKKVLIQVGRNGIVVDGRLYQFQELEEFSIIYHPPNVKVLYVEPKSPLRPRLRLFLADQNPIELRRHLLGFMKEDLALQEEHISDIVARLLKM